MRIPKIQKKNSKKLPKYDLGSDGMYTIQKGDNLTKIAERYNTTVDEIMKNNPSITNPDLIYAGNQLRIGPQQPKYYIAGAHQNPAPSGISEEERVARIKQRLANQQANRQMQLPSAQQRFAPTPYKSTYDLNAQTAPSVAQSNNDVITGNGRTFVQNPTTGASAEVFGVHQKPKGKQQTEDQRRASLRRYIKQQRMRAPKLGR